MQTDLGFYGKFSSRRNKPETGKTPSTKLTKLFAMLLILFGGIHKDCKSLWKIFPFVQLGLRKKKLNIFLFFPKICSAFIRHNFALCILDSLILQKVYKYPEV